jgi:hypothetical protein
MPVTVRLLVVGVPLLILALAALWTVRGYELGGGSLSIQRGFWRTRVSLAGLLSASTDAQALRSSLRLFGNGGLFSFSGLFWNRRLGRFRIFATDPARAVVLRFEHRTIVVTPDRPGDFVAAVRDAVTAS